MLSSCQSSSEVNLHTSLMLTSSTYDFPCYVALSSQSGWSPCHAVVIAQRNFGEFCGVVLARKLVCLTSVNKDLWFLSSITYCASIFCKCNWWMDLGNFSCSQACCYVCLPCSRLFCARVSSRVKWKWALMRNQRHLFFSLRTIHFCGTSFVHG